MNEIVIYTTELGNSPYKKYMDDLEKKNKTRDVTRIRAYVKRLRDYGMAVNNVHPKTILPLRDDIYELRPDGHRVLFFYYSGDEFVLLHIFKKQHGKAPPHEIDKAKKEKDDYIRRRKKQNGGEHHF